MPAARLHRLIWAALGVSALSVLALARALTPDPSGMGTHTQLGLPPCGFLHLTGLPCPACGLTTSFAHMAHFSLTRAFEAHWLGPPLFALTAFIALLAAWGCRTARSPVETMNHLRVGRVAAIIAAAAVAAWSCRLAVLLVV